jgi:hypothetical protein
VRTLHDWLLEAWLRNIEVRCVRESLGFVLDWEHGLCHWLKIGEEW